MAQLRNVYSLDNEKGTGQTCLSFLFAFTNVTRMLKRPSDKDGGDFSKCIFLLLEPHQIKKEKEEKNKKVIYF